MKRMVALLDKSPLPSKTALRARGATSLFQSHRATAVKSRNRTELGRSIYDACRRLGSCSNEGGGSENEWDLYEYVLSSPMLNIDPSGYTFGDVMIDDFPVGDSTTKQNCSNGKGNATCTPGKCTPGRGTLKFAALGRYLERISTFPPMWHYGVAFLVNFWHIENAFKTPQCDCCCCDIGFIQHISRYSIKRSKSNLKKNPFPILNDGKDGVYYPLDQSGNPCFELHVQRNFAQMSDSPGLAFGALELDVPTSLSIEGIVCAVCKSGKEASTNARPNSLRTATIYDCLKWEAYMTGVWTREKKPRLRELSARSISCQEARRIEAEIAKGFWQATP